MSIPRQLPHTWTLLERSAKPTLEQLTSALLTDWAADPAAVDLDLILAQLRAATKAGAPTRGPDFAEQLGHLVWWEQAKLASTHLGLLGSRRQTELGTAFELGLLLISTGADHPHLQEASLTDMHEAWVRHVAGDDPTRAANLREQLVVLVVVEGKGSLAPDLYVIADALLARLEPLALNQIRRYEFEAQESEPIGGGSEIRERYRHWQLIDAHRLGPVSKARTARTASVWLHGAPEMCEGPSGHATPPAQRHPHASPRGPRLAGVARHGRPRCA